MEVKEKIRSLLNEAELYRKQGLLTEAKERYIQAGQLVKKFEKDIKNKNILISISQKLKELNEEINRIENAPTMVKMPESVQNIIRSKFSFSEDEDQRALEGAIALAKFGQFERALAEFNELIQKDSLRVDAAKNIIRCHMALDSLDKAVNQYEKWISDALFSTDQLNKLRTFLQGVLDKKGVKKELPVPVPSIEAVKPATEPQKTQPPEESSKKEEAEAPVDVIDISSVAITIQEGPKKGETIEFDVSFQSGNVINLLISSKDKELIESLKNGMTLNDVQFFSPIAMFNGTGVIASKTVIESGPKKGDYSLDIKIKSI